MKKVTAGATALALAGIGSVTLAGPGGAQEVEDIPGLPGTLYEAEITGGFHDEIQLDNPGFSNVQISSGIGSSAPGCTLADGQVAAAIAIELWNFQEDGEPALLDSGYIISDAEFWGEDPAQFFNEGDLDGWTGEGFPTPLGKSNGQFTTGGFEPPAVNGEQIFVGHCIVVEADDAMEGNADDLDRADEAFVGSYMVTGAPDDGGDPDPDDGDDGGDPDPDDGGDPDDGDGAPSATPVSGTPSFTG